MRKVNIPSMSVLVSKENMARAIQELYSLIVEIADDSQDESQNESLRKANSEIYTLKQTIGNMGGAVTYEFPDTATGKNFGTLMNNNGTVKLTDDVTASRMGPGVLASNKVTLNLNNHNLSIPVSANTAAIQARGTQEVTIKGKGTIDADKGICVMCNGKDAVINLSGTTTTYQTDRPDAELIYCYQGTINISGGTFKNNGSRYLLNCYDANYRSGIAKISVTGGKFYDFNPGNNTAEGDGTSYLAEGYKSTATTVIEDEVEHTVYTVSKV